MALGSRNKRADLTFTVSLIYISEIRLDNLYSWKQCKCNLRFSYVRTKFKSDEHKNVNKPHQNNSQQQQTTY